MRNGEVNVEGILRRTTLCRFDNIVNEFAVLIPATDKQIETIEKLGCFTVGENKDGKQVIVSDDKVFLYGAIDVDSSEDIEVIKSLNLVNDVIAPTRSWVPKSFNYSSGTQKTKDKIKLVSDPVENFMYNYCLIGKPDNIICFRISEIQLKHLK